jgi:hypothetical protein
MMNRVYVDFQKIDTEGRLVLTCAGTIRDVGRLGVRLRDGLQLEVYSDDLDAENQRDDLYAEGVVRYDIREARWVLELVPGSVRHASEDTQ